MRFVDMNAEGLQPPQTSVSGDTGLPAAVLLDTGWDVEWAGPGHIYLSDRDLVDIVVPSLEREAVQDALKSNGWTAPGATADRVAELEEELAFMSEELADAKIAEAGFDKALAKLQAAKPAPAAAKTKAKE